MASDTSFTARLAKACAGVAAGSVVLAGQAHALGGGVGGVTQPVTAVTSAVTSAPAAVQSAPPSGPAAVHAPVQAPQQATPPSVEPSVTAAVQSTPQPAAPVQPAQQAAAPAVQAAQQTVASAVQIVTTTATTVTQHEPVQTVAQTVDRTAAAATQDVAKTAAPIASSEPVRTATSLVTGAGDQLTSGTPAAGVIRVVTETRDAATGGLELGGRPSESSLLAGGARIGAVPLAGSAVGPAAAPAGVTVDGAAVGLPSRLALSNSAAGAATPTPVALATDPRSSALASVATELAETLRELVAGAYAGLAGAASHVSAAAAAPLSRDSDVPLPGRAPGGFFSGAAGAAALLAFAVLALALLPFMLAGPRAGPWLRLRAERIPLAAFFATLERPG